MYQGLLRFFSIVVISFSISLVSCGGGGGGDSSGDVENEPPGSEKAITSFTFSHPSATGIIDQDNHTIEVTVPCGTVVNSLTPTISYSGESIDPVSDVAQDFSTPVIYTVTAEDGSTQEYTVSVDVALSSSKEITSFSFDNPSVVGAINNDNYTITIHVPFNTDISNLTPSINHTGNTISPDSGVAQDFTSQVNYIVTAEDASSQEYTVNIEVPEIRTFDTSSIPGDVVEVACNTTSFTMIYANDTEGIEFPTGSSTSTVNHKFFIGETEVTWELWSIIYEWAVNGTGDAVGEGEYSIANAGARGGYIDNYDDTFPYYTGHETHPVTMISWRDAIVWCNALTEWYNANNGTNPDLDCVYYTDLNYDTPLRVSTDSYTVTETTHGTQDCPYIKADTLENTEMLHCTANGFRLPTGNEWEFAARFRGSDPVNTVPGYNNPYYTNGDSASGAIADHYDDFATGLVAVYDDGIVTSTAEVKSKNANTLGVYDMSGNVMEWCFRGYDSFFWHAIRGGHWYSYSIALETGVVHSAFVPYFNEETTGFRIVKSK